MVGGYPGTPYMVEWATTGGGAGSWLKLTWASAHTFNTIVLYDRPNSANQITGGNIQFSDGSSVTVGALPNDGSAYTLSFAAKTATWLQLNITSVSASTVNVGLAEIQIYNAPPPNGWVGLWNDGAYIAHFSVSWQEKDGPKSWDSGEQPAGYWYKLSLPGDATRIQIVARDYTGLIWSPEAEAINTMIGSPDNKWYRIYGTTLAPKWDNQAPPGSG